MTVKDQLIQFYKSRDFVSLSDQFIQHPEQLKDLVELATGNLPYPFPEYASWLLVHVTKKNPALISTFQTDFIDCILTSKNQSVLRNLVNCTVQLPLTEYREAEFLDRLISFISDDSNKAALFVYSSYKLVDFVKIYPELKNEIEQVFSLIQTNTIKPSMKVAIREFRVKTTN